MSKPANPRGSPTYIRAETHKLLDAIRKRTGLTRAEAVHRAVREYLERTKQ